MLHLTCSKLLIRLFLIKCWIYQKKKKKDFAGGKEVLNLTEVGGGGGGWGKTGKFHPKLKRSGFSPGIPFPLSPLPNICTSEQVHFQGSDSRLVADRALNYEDGVEFSHLKTYNYIQNKYIALKKITYFAISTQW